MYKGIIIFGAMASGKDTLGLAIVKQSPSAAIFHLGKYIRRLGNLYGGVREDYQNIAEGMREKVDVEVWNKITEKEINDAVSKESNIYPLICDGRQLHEVKYWGDRDYLMVGIHAPIKLRTDRLQNRDGYLPPVSAIMHYPEITAHFIATQLCDIQIRNDIDDLECLDVAARTILLKFKGDN